MLRIGKGTEIRSVEDWFEYAPPKKGLKQWVDGRSAKELAKAWFPANGEPQVPPELASLLESREETRGVAFDKGEPELTTGFDACGGEPRNADLVLWGQSPCGKVLAAIEAKADEEFGPVAGMYVEQSRARPGSRVPERFSLLCEGLLGVNSDDENARALRYQLLTATAGALVDAHKYGAGIVLFIVHEFVGMTDASKLQANAADLNRFIRLLSSGSIESLSPGLLAGPFTVPGNKYFAGTKQLFVGKCRRSV